MAKTILLVDDEPNIVLSLEFLMKRAGYEVRVASDGDAAMDMLTAKGRDVEREKGLAMGADDYITKPFSTQEVVDKVRAMVGED